MLEFIQNQILFYVSLALVMFLPGRFLLLAIFGKSRTLSTLEKFIFSFGLSVICVDFIFFAYSGLKIPIDRLTTVAGIIIFALACFVIYKLRSAKNKFSYLEGDKKLFNFSKNQLALILLLLFLTFFIKTIYLNQTISPSSTDLGHHMYWSKWMVENHKLPDYEGMPDFIIGEQTMFGAIALVSGLDFFSAFPPLVLLLMNLLGILTVFVLTLRIFREKNIAILSLFFLGFLYAISAPQAKFVSGGVIGNLIGNFFLPLAFYFYYRAFQFINICHPELEFSLPAGRQGSNVIPAPAFAKINSSGIQSSKLDSGSEAGMTNRSSRAFLGLAIFATFGLFYTHHLTAFLFLFIFSFFILLFLALNYRNVKTILKNSLKIFFSPTVLAVFVLGMLFFFFVFTPNYVNPDAVNTAVGAPSKATRAGLSIANLRATLGEARLSLGFFGLLLLLFSAKRKDFGYLLLASWAIILFLISTKPDIFFVNLPSNRIGNYLSYPLSILGAYAVYLIFKNESAMKNSLIKIGFLLILGFALIEGITDSAKAIPSQANYAALVQTFQASSYLADRTTPADQVLKDHNYISGDSWMKLFFMRGYKYPLSRGYFKRYEDETKPREMCTLYMISSPGSPESQTCFSETGTNFVMVNPRFDSGQFRKLENFSQVYFGPEIAIYYKSN